MANLWLRLWHDMPNDPKWRTIAKISEQPIALVQAVYLQLLVSASQNPVTNEAGVTLHTVTVTNEDIASSLDVTERDVSRVTEAMQGRVLNGKTLSGWDKRQAPQVNYKNPGKPAMTGAERTAKCRERKKERAAQLRDETQGNVSETLRNDVTTQIRKEKIREDLKELKDPPISSPRGGAARRNKITEYSDDFESVWLVYPKRAGGANKAGAYKSWNARLKEGFTPGEIRQGVIRYASYIEATGKLGSEYVQQAQTFFGKSLYFAEAWPLPKGQTVNASGPLPAPDKKIPSGFRG